MSGGSGMSAAQTVTERRLRPIYDSLDNGNNKKALAEAEKVLKKQPDLQCCRALMALALLRLGRDSEAETHLNTLVKEAPTDEAVLQAMTIAYKELQQPENICKIYELATKKEPQHEELLSTLFMSYVRLSMYKKQQQAAMQLYKVKPKNPYYFWAVMSAVLQATSSSPTSSSGGESSAQGAIMLQLAERMIDKMAKEKKVEQEQETQLYLMVLELQHKFREALGVLEGPLGRKLEETSSFVNLVPSRKLEYLKKLEMWRGVNALSKQMLLKSPDQWNVYLDYITSVLRIIDADVSSENGEAGDEESEVDSTVEDARRFILSQQEANTKCRGPYLAEMELQCRLVARRDEKANEVQLIDLLVHYFDRFGQKPCCTSDLKLFLTSLDSSEYEAFFDRSRALIKLGEKNEPSTVDDIYRLTSWHQLRNVAGLNAGLTTEQRCEVVQELECLFLACHPLVKDYSKTEQRPSDMFVVLAAHLLWEMWVETREDRYFWKAVLQLEYARKLSRTNFHVMFLLVKFYNQIGAVGSSNSVHSGLELKYIQLDSLGHVMSRRILTCFHLMASTELYSNTLKFFTGNYKDTVEHIMSAYRYGSFDKIREFIKLRERLSVSQHYSATTVERLLLDLLTAQDGSAKETLFQIIANRDVEPEKDEIAWKDLTDNRDFQAMMSYDAAEKAVTDELISESFVQEQKFLKVRSLILRSLVGAFSLVEDPPQAAVPHGVTNGSSESGADGGLKMLEVIESLSAQLEEAVASCGDINLGDDWLNPVQGPERPRLHIYLRDGVVAFHRQMLELVVRTRRRLPAKTGAPFSWTAADLSLIESVGSSYAQMVKTQCQRLGKAGQSMLDRESHFEAVFNLIESSSFACILCDVCHSLLKPYSKAGGGKKSKKRREISEETAKSLCSFNDLLCSLSGSLGALLNSANEYEKCLNVEDKMSVVENQFSTRLGFASPAESERFAVDDLDKKCLDSLQEEVALGVEESYHVSFLHVNTLCKDKLKILESLKLAC